MTLIKSISGFRGTIGGRVGDTLNPVDIAKSVAAYASLREKVVSRKYRRKIVVGRDARISGEMVSHVVCGTLMSMGFDVVNIGLASTPTTELAVTLESACGGIIITASHNPRQWNALKFLNEHGEFLPPAEASEVVRCANADCYEFADVDNLGCDIQNYSPEPLKEHLSEIRNLMRKGRHDIGFVVDPDADRLALICEDGTMFGEENTLVAVADYVLQHTPGNTVSNLSSTRGLRDVTEKHGCNYTPAAVGEVNVVTKMKETGAVIGGEGNGGVIYPAAHSGRDALVGIALILTHLAKLGCKTSELRDSLPQYFISKNRIDLKPTTDIFALLQKVKEIYKDEQITDIDGVKIDFADKWVHLRKSNTEPIIRVYAEAHTREEADALAQQIVDMVYTMTQQ